PHREGTALQAAGPSNGSLLPTTSGKNMPCYWICSTKVRLTFRAARGNVPAARAGIPLVLPHQTPPRRRRMRHSLPAALVAILLSAQAAAQDEGEEKAEGEGAPTGSLADGGDPVDEE